MTSEELRKLIDESVKANLSELSGKESAFMSGIREIIKDTVTPSQNTPPPPKDDKIPGGDEIEITF